MDDELLLEERFTLFTPDLDFGILQMRNNLKEIIPDLAEESERDLVFDVIHEFCESITAQLNTYIIEFSLLHEFDILYLRRRNIFTNETLANTLSFLHREFYASIPQAPSPHCLNLCFVNTGEALVPHFYLKRPLPPRSVQKQLEYLLRGESKRVVGDTLYLIHEAWFKSWKQQPQPGPINNIPNVDTVTLNGFNCESPDYYSLPEWGWRLLIAWHGILGCKLGIQRVVIKDTDSDIVLESTPFDIWCFLYPNDIEFQVIKLRSEDGIDKLKSKIKRVYSIKPQIESRLYSRFVLADTFRSQNLSSKCWELLGDAKDDSKSLRGNGAVMLVTQDGQFNWPDPNELIV